jgi:uncharacterized protein DUF4082
MTEVALQANTPNATWVRQAWNSSYPQLAIRFQVTTAGFVKAVAWYQTAGADVRPTKIGIYGAGALLWSDVAVPEDVAVPGWQWLTLATKLQLNVGTTYALALDSPNPGGHTVGTPADRFAAPDPFLWDDAMHHRNLSYIPVYPNTARTDFIIGLNLIWEDVSHVDDRPPVGVGNAAEALVDWFDPTAATKPGEDEKLYPRVASMLDGIDFAGFIAQIGDIWNIAGQLADLEIAAFNALTGKIKSWVGWVADDNTALRRPDGTTVLDDTQGLITGQNALEAQLNTIQAQLTALADAISDAEGAIGAFPIGWTLLAEEDFVSNHAFAEPAHLYVLTVTDYPATTGNVATAAGLWLPRLGWWTELNGSQAGARGFVEFQQQQLHAGGRAMAGCAVQLKTGTLATIQAWGAP